MKSDEVGTTLKHPETINGNVKNLSKKIRRKGTQNPSPMPLDPKGKREEKGRNARTITKDSIHNSHACKNK